MLWQFGRWLGVFLTLILCQPGSHSGLRAQPFAPTFSPAVPLAGFSIFAAPASLVVQGEIPSLTGDPIKREISGGAVQSFSISLKSGQYLRLLIEQHGIILQATLFDANTNRIAEMDSPSFGHGPIYLSTIATESQVYRLEVRSTESWANPAWFEVMIEEQRDPTPQDKERIRAETIYAEGRQLEKQATETSRTAAINRYKTSLKIWQDLGDVHWSAITLYSIGSVHRSLGNYKEAAEYFKECLAPELSNKLKPDDWRLIASAWNDLGLTLADSGDEKTAFASIDKALKLYQDHGDRRGQASALNNIGVTYKMLGRFTEAVEYFEKSLPLRRAENDQLREFNIINNIGASYDALGEPQKALESCSQTLQVWRELYNQDKLGDPDRLAGALNNTAAAYERLGDWQKAMDSYEEALAISKKSGNRQRQAATLNNLGDLYHKLGDAASALEYYNEALALIRNNVKDPRAEASILTQIGQLQMAEEDLTQALEYFAKAKAIPQIPQREAELLNSTGLTYSLKGNPTEALKLYDQALDKSRISHDRRGEAATLNKRAEAYGQLGNPSQALLDLNSARSLWISVQDQRGEALALQDMARIEGDRQNLKEALKFSDEAIRIIESLRTKVSSHQLRTSYFAAQEDYYEVNIDLNMKLWRKGESPENLAAALEASERSRARSLIDTLVEARANITEGADPTLLRHEHEVEHKLRAKTEARIQLLNTRHDEAEAKSLAKDIRDLIAESVQLGDKIRVSSPKYAHLTQPLTLTTKEIAQGLDANTLLLEYALGEQRSYVWVVTPDSIKGFELPGRKEIEATAERMLKALTERNPRGNESPQQAELHRDRADAEYSKAAAELGKMVIRPVADLLGHKRLVIVADGALQRVSFGALPVPNSATPAAERTAASAPKKSAAMNDPKPLIEDHEIVYEASASVLALQRKEFGSREPARHLLAVLADPVVNQEGFKLELEKRRAAKARERQPQTGGDSSGSSSDASAHTGADLTRAIDDMGLDSISSLPESRAEADSIMKLVPKGEGMEALGFDASRATVMNPDLSQYRIIHFATHGFANFKHPELSGIVLSLVDEKGQPQDGFFRLHDIYNLNLPADLVVLSACQTGVGKQIKGEGLIALTRGFTYAGAARVVASLWKVDDEATRRLMEEFYQQMFSRGLKPAAALHQAQLKMSHQSQWRSPFYWAGFVLQGEWK
jgi:CHAT domain-containing protein/tetratricopeptide (TPR) repeat protein